MTIKREAKNDISFAVLPGERVKRYAREADKRATRGGGEPMVASPVPVPLQLWLLVPSWI
jgi:hypothetical protein